MRRNETANAQTVACKTLNHGGRFTPVFDSRKRKIRGLWKRNGKFYAQMRVDAGGGKTKPARIALKAEDLEAAKAELEERRTENRQGTIHAPGHRPKFEKLVEEYCSSAGFLTKKKGTRKNEIQALARWVARIGGVRVDWIKKDVIADYHKMRLAGGVAPRTVNLDTTAFSNAMRHAVDQGWLVEIPKVKKLKETPAPRRKLLTKQEIDAVLDAAKKATKNGTQLCLYLRFLMATGAREKEALRVRKADVDMVREVVRIGNDGDTKNRQARDIQFNAALRSVLSDILAALPQETQWLFPSPQRGKKDIHSKTFRESLRLVRKEAGLPGLGFHDFRHYFASACVMTGIDFMTIAKWLGHQDGGILVAKVYGHLNDSHQRKAAEKLEL